LILDGGVLQSSSFGNSFTRPLGTSGNALQWSANGGGFSAGTYPLNVNIGNGTALTWGNNVSSQIVGTLKLSSATAESVTNFSNNIDLGGEDRSIQVEDNPNSINDYADMPGAITNTSGIAGIRKIGNGMLALTGTNSYNGTTTLDAGTLRFLAAVAMPTGAYVINDGTLDIIGITKSIAAFSINNGNIKGSGTLTSNSAYDAKAGSVNVRLGGIVGLDKSGSGTLTLSMANTYSGETVVEQGLLKITGSILNSSRVTVDAEGILELTKLSGSATAATVPIDNQGLLLISQGSHVVGTIAGNGITQIYPNATLIAHSIEQDTLIIGQAVSSNATALNAVPEPSTFALVLASLLTVLLAQFRRRMTP
jgi:autotransporter-associated beta strand protein